MGVSTVLDCKRGIMSNTSEVTPLNEVGETREESRASLIQLLNLSNAQEQALADKYNKLQKLIKREVRVNAPGFDNEVEMFIVYTIHKVANDFIRAQAKDRWVSDLEIYIPRLMTKDANLSKSTDAHVAKIAREIEDVDMRLEVITTCKKNLLPKSTDAFTLLQCFERLETLFTSAWKK